MNNQKRGYGQLPAQTPQIPQTTTMLELNSFDPNFYNVLMPVTKMAAPSDLQRVMVNVVHLDCRQDQSNNGPSKDIYFEKSCGKFAITKVAGMKLAAAANISIVETATGRSQACERCIEMAKSTGRSQPCGTCPHVYDTKVSVTLRVPEPSGGFRLMTASREFDTTTETNTGMTDKQRQRIITNRAAVCESKAFMRAIRAALGLAGSYTMEDIKKPFVVAHIVPNFNAPEIREVMAANVMQSMGMMFAPSGGSTAALPEAAPAREFVNDETLPATFEDPTVYEQEDDFVEPVYGPGGPYAQNGNPYAQAVRPPQMPSSNQGLVCTECGKAVTDHKGKRGTMTADNIARYSTQTIGRVVCYTCQQKLRSGGRNNGY